MATYIRDGHLNVIGRIETMSDGTQQIFDSHGAFKGKYDPKMDQTLNERMNFVGKGNLLCTLVR